MSFFVKLPNGNGRRVVTDAEKILAKALARRRIRFKPQCLIVTHNGNRFLVDFIVEGKLVIEVDGSTHSFNEKKRIKDAKENVELKSMGYKVLRVRNIDIYKRLPEVIAKIKEELKET